MARPHGTSVLYEPRVLWDSARIRPTEAQPVFVEMDPKRFRNGTRYPIVVQYVLLSPLGYTLQRFDTVPPIDTITYKNAMAAALACKVRITAPGRKHLSRSLVPSGGYRPSAVGCPRPNSDFASSLFGLSRWDFEFPNDEGMVMPRLGQIQFDISGYTFPNVGIATPTPTDAFVTAHAAFFERQDVFWGGGARYSGALPIQPKVPINGESDGIYPQTPAPVPEDGWGYGIPAVGQQQRNLTFDKNGIWNHKRWMQDEADVGTDRDRFCGFAVALDQISLDGYMQTSAQAGVPANPLAPLSQRVALQAKMLAGGSGEEWFYPEGAPLSLCCPTINEAAVVHRFDDPISLDPNAGLRIEIEAPPALIQDDVVFPGIYNLGVSLVGYAIIEGLD
jgi:hypothetical protein